MSKKDELLQKINELSNKIGHYKVYLNVYKTDEGMGMGYYFDQKDKLWKSYVFGQHYNFISEESENEIDVIEDLYDTVCSEAEAHENPLEKIKNIIPKLRITVYLNHYSSGQYVIGYCYNTELKSWVAYENDERNRSSYCECDCEEEAIVELYKTARNKLWLQS